MGSGSRAKHELRKLKTILDCRRSTRSNTLCGTMSYSGGGGYDQRRTVRAEATATGAATTTTAEATATSVVGAMASVVRATTSSAGAMTTARTVGATAAMRIWTPR
ncbi:hypothetical protein PF004_g17203 [Phytophthora fragariae]|nr:hypothetical protein PF004_g17203 [Phytophthora fragariae]